MWNLCAVQYRCSQFGSEYTDTKTWWSIIWCKYIFCMHQVCVVCILVTTAWYNLLGKRILLNGWSLLGWYTKVDLFFANTLRLILSYTSVSESLILAEYQPGHFVNASVAGMSISTENTFFVVPLFSPCMEKNLSVYCPIARKPWCSSKSTLHRCMSIVVCVELKPSLEICLFLCYICFFCPCWRINVKAAACLLPSLACESNYLSRAFYLNTIAANIHLVLHLLHLRMPRLDFVIICTNWWIIGQRFYKNKNLSSQSIYHGTYLAFFL